VKIYVMYRVHRASAGDSHPHVGMGNDGRTILKIYSQRMVCVIRWSIEHVLLLLLWIGQHGRLRRSGGVLGSANGRTEFRWFRRRFGTDSRI
jgi:hypothetical protein